MTSLLSKQGVTYIIWETQRVMSYLSFAIDIQLWSVSHQNRKKEQQQIYLYLKIGRTKYHNDQTKVLMWAVSRTPSDQVHSNPQIDGLKIFRDASIMILSLILLLAVMEKALCIIGPRSSPLKVDFFIVNNYLLIFFINLFQARGELSSVLQTELYAGTISISYFCLVCLKTFRNNPF